MLYAFIAGMPCASSKPSSPIVPSYYALVLRRNAEGKMHGQDFSRGASSKSD